MDDFGLGPTGTEGTKWMRIVSGLVGAGLGGLMGYFYSTIGSATLSWLVYVTGGALVGGFFGALFSFYIILGLVVILAVGAVLVYQWYFGGN